MKHPPQETDLVPGRRIAAATIGAVIATAAGVLIAYGVGDCASTDATTRWMSGSPPAMPREINAMETAVFAVEAQGVEANQRAEAHLASYGWVDEERGIIHVPIDVAFDLYLAGARGAR